MSRRRRHRPASEQWAMTPFDIVVTATEPLS